MGTRQVLRAALPVALLLWSVHASAERARGAVVDLRAHANDGLVSQLRDLLRANGTEPVESLALAKALTADPSAATTQSEPAPSGARQKLEQATRAFGELKCTEASELATAAAKEQLALAAASEGKPLLSRAFAIAFLCADGAGQQGTAQAFANRLRALGTDPPAGIPSATWSRYPGVDVATNVFLSRTKIRATPAGARVSINLVTVGVAPLDLSLPAGEHWVVVSVPGRARVVQTLIIEERKDATLDVTVPAAELDPRKSIGRIGDALPSERLSVAGVTTAMQEASVAIVAVVRDRPGQTIASVEIFVLTSANAPAKLVVRAPWGPALREAVYDVTHLPLLATAPRPAKGPDQKVRRWWIWGAAIGAVLLGAGAVVLSETAHDTQTINVTWSP